MRARAVGTAGTIRRPARSSVSRCWICGTVVGDRQATSMRRVVNRSHSSITPRGVHTTATATTGTNTSASSSTPRRAQLLAPMAGHRHGTASTDSSATPAGDRVATSEAGPAQTQHTAMEAPQDPPARWHGLRAAGLCVVQVAMLCGAGDEHTSCRPRRLCVHGHRCCTRSLGTAAAHLCCTAPTRWPRRRL